MDDHVYRVTEIVGSSTEGIDQAIRHALERAQQERDPLKGDVGGKRGGYRREPANADEHAVERPGRELLGVSA